MAKSVPLIAVMILLSVPVVASRAGSIEIFDAQVPPTTEAGVDVPLLMRVANHGAQADALLRVHCPFANFSERHTVDYGEGAPAMRAIPSIPLPPGAEVALTTKSYHVMLLQTREALTDGQLLICSATFRVDGSQDIQVRVSLAAAQH